MPVHSRVARLIPATHIFHITQRQKRGWAGRARAKFIQESGRGNGRLQIFEAGNVVLQSGLTYRNARLAYKTYGTLNADKSNVIVYPTSYGAPHTDLEWQVGPGERSTRRSISSSS